MEKLKTVKELQELIENNDVYNGCAIDLPTGQYIGTTSGGWQPLLYINDEDRCPQSLTWEEALKIYNKAVTQKTVIYEVSVEDAQAEIDFIESEADPDDVDDLIAAWVGGTITMEEIYLKIKAYQYQN
jgi:hypothetical protein